MPLKVLISSTAAAADAALGNYIYGCLVLGWSAVSGTADTLHHSDTWTTCQLSVTGHTDDDDDGPSLGRSKMVLT